MISLNNEPCCICNDTRSRLMQSATYPEHGYPGDFSLRKCATCGLLFNSPRLDNTELAQLYGRNYYFFNRSDAVELLRIAPMYARSVALVADQVKEKRTLDIGSGRGYLPAVLKQLGWDAHGVEISSDAARYARERFGLSDIYTGTIEQYASSNEARTFPLVTAIDVIEHVPSPRAFVEAIAKVVEPGGLLILDTPNAAAYNITVDGVNWKGFNPFHIYLFSIANLTRLLEQNGFTVERSFSYGNVKADEKPHSSRLRLKAIEFARFTRLIRPTAHAYFAYKAWKTRKQNPDDAMRVTLQQIRLNPDYAHSTDAREPLARDASGDNIVVIARRASSAPSAPASASASAS